jgi:ABC-type uncharacterized transport system YnjBCD ATPase subunit
MHSASVPFTSVAPWPCGKPSGIAADERAPLPPLQDDVLYESLTVWETLLYAALLRLPRTMTPEAKRERVESVVTSLGLGKSRNTIIGG